MPDLDLDVHADLSPALVSMSNPTHDPFYSSPFGPFYRRHSPYMVQPEYRIYEMNKRLQARTEVSAVRGPGPGSGWSGGEVPVELRFGNGGVTGELCEAPGSVGRWRSARCPRAKHSKSRADPVQVQVQVQVQDQVQVRVQVQGGLTCYTQRG